MKGIGGFYYIHAHNQQIYECRAKGIFRNQNIKPLVGDQVVIEVLDESKAMGNITQILKRQNELIRPLASNVDQAMVIFSADHPAPNLNLLDRFLIMMEKQELSTYICFNKSDIVSEIELERLGEHYIKAGYEVMFTSTYTGCGIDACKSMLHGKTTIVAGPSGVGKSSLINRIYPGANMETGDISEKIKRGKHTTRHSELFLIDTNTYIMDTPGFSSLNIEGIEQEELKDYFIEFAPYERTCRFIGCHHLNEPDCSVKTAVEHKRISKNRYENYKLLYEEIKNKKKY